MAAMSKQQVRIEALKLALTYKTAVVKSPQDYVDIACIFEKYLSISSPKEKTPVVNR